ncbi:MAG: thioredoxin family protein [Dehalococcoidia bacterium]|nr:thioredoxin family protein [Dehalococcoidia bacterium]
MSAMEVIFVAKADCGNCERVRQALTRVHHEYRHVEVREVDPDEPDGRSLAAEHGVLILPALIVAGRLRLVGEMRENEIRREIEKAKHISQH